MNSEDVRTTFVRYFERHGHLHLPSASLVVHGDPSVLLTSAGMQQFKPYYIDPSTAPSRRVVTIQRCMRTSDIDEVGDDTHHSFFEMLGNFAFGGLDEGGYFKKEAMAFGYEVVTKEYGLDHDRIWATTWAGEAGIPPDDEAVELWKAIGVPPLRIRPLNKKPDGSRENFWGPTGDSGPCGPCSEIHYDVLGACPLGASDEECGPEHGCGRIVEIWNLVFNQFFQEKDRSLRPLERTGIDTGSGYERVAAILAGKRSAYETDLMWPLIEEAQNVLDAPYGEDPNVTRALRIVVDHARAVTFMIADGVFPSNEERGYVARRMLRRAVRYGRQLGRHEPFLGRIAHVAIERYAPHYPHLREKQAVIEQQLEQEEVQFGRTLSAGTEMLGQEMDRLERAGQRTIPGPTVFRLYDTFGFPAELTQEAAASRGFQVDVEAFEREMEAGRERSRAGSQFGGQGALDLPRVTTQFLGYDTLDVADARVEYVRRGDQEADVVDASGDEVWVVLDRSPFYAERGGQVGDAGELTGPRGRMQVRTTRAPGGDTIVHIGVVVEGSIAKGDTVRASVTESARRATMRHHTATHLLHAALREVLGPHVHQAGSLVAPDRLRFDFTHGQALSGDERRAVQRCVNDVVLRNVDVQTEILSLDAAMRSGAIALFDEKYGDAVRVVSVGDFSKELCGGTHVQRSGDIGLFVLLGESSIGSGQRRVEALAGSAAEEFLNRQLELLDEAARAAGSTRDDLPARVAQIASEASDLRRKLEAAERKAAQQGITGLLEAAQDVPGKDGQPGYKVLAAEIDAKTAPSMDRLREVADWLRDKLGGPSVLILASVTGDRPQLLTMVAPPLVQRGLHAGKLLNETAQAMGGRGGGRPELAQGGGGDPARLRDALDRGRQAALSA